MKKVFASALLFLCFLADSYGQTSTNVIRKQSIGFSLIINDFATAQRIRTTSLSAVLRDKQFAKSDGFAYGFAVNYMKGLTPHVDFAATLGSTFSTEVSFPGRTDAGDNTLLELDASGHFKMFTEKAVFNPYLIAGIGVSKYTDVYGAIVPLGGGVKLRLFDEAEFHTQFQYRIPVTTDANNYHFQLSFGVTGLF